ncbi:hypothetical protein OQA88_686 [Cercophora sp. LCS_1]
MTDSKTQYNPIAPLYTSVTTLPCSIIEAQLITRALTPCTDLHILDLGGGSGLHARRALDLGAASVDVVDISAEMLRAGQEIESSLNRSQTRWFEADLSKPLPASLGLREEGYDIVMANWLFDHAGSREELKGMWQNIVTWLKPGGRFLGVRVYNIEAEYMKVGRYGARFEKVERVDEGWKYWCSCLTEQEFGFDCSSVDDSLTLRDEIPKALGLVEFESVPPAEMDCVKEDEAFWADFVREPNLAVVTARKPEA